MMMLMTGDNDEDCKNGELVMMVMMVMMMMMMTLYAASRVEVLLVSMRRMRSCQIRSRS